jgi:hypothetical protein
MNGSGSPLLSVRAEARRLVAPDFAVVDGVIEHTEGSKVEAVRSVAGSLDRLTADLGALGPATRRSPPSTTLDLPPTRTTSTPRSCCPGSAAC